MVDGITEYIATCDATQAANQMVRDVVLGDQLDPADVARSIRV